VQTYGTGQAGALRLRRYFVFWLRQSFESAGAHSRLCEGRSI
jgi:hypothetical protein